MYQVKGDLVRGGFDLASNMEHNTVETCPEERQKGPSGLLSAACPKAMAL